MRWYSTPNSYGGLIFLLPRSIVSDPWVTPFNFAQNLTYCVPDQIFVSCCCSQDLSLSYNGINLVKATPACILSRHKQTDFNLLMIVHVESDCDTRSVLFQAILTRMASIGGSPRGFLSFFFPPLPSFISLGWLKGRMLSPPQWSHHRSLQVLHSAALGSILALL